MWLETGMNPVESGRTAVHADGHAPLSPQIVSTQKSQLSILLPRPLALYNDNTRLYTHKYRPPGKQTWRRRIRDLQPRHLVIYGLLHERRKRHISRDRAEQDRRQCLPWNCRRPFENRVQLRKLGLAAGSWPTVKGGRKSRREDR